MAINFPDSPTPGQIFQNYVWDGEKWLGASTAAGAAVVGAVRYDQAQALTANQKAQARANTDALKKNYVVNGAMMVSQENGSSSVVAANSYPVDQFIFTFNTGAISGQQRTTEASPGGSPNRMRLTVTTADATVGAADVANITQVIEGLRMADLLFGTTSAKTVTVQFGVKAPAGTYCVTFTNAAVNRCYVAEYVIAVGEANTDVIKSITIPGDTTGTWLKDNGVGMFLRWGLMAGANWQQPAGAWSGASINTIGSPNQFNFMGTVNNVFELFDVGLYEGNVAPAFQVPDYGSELVLCQRYFQKWTSSMTTAFYQNYGGASNVYTSWTISPPMRAAPTATLLNVTYSSASALLVNLTTPTLLRVIHSTPGSSTGYAAFDVTFAARL